MVRNKQAFVILKKVGQMLISACKNSINHSEIIEGSVKGPPYDGPPLTNARQSISWFS